jgi:hypothetical protein
MIYTPLGLMVRRQYFRLQSLRQLLATMLLIYKGLSPSRRLTSMSPNVNARLPAWTPGGHLQQQQQCPPGKQS